MDRVEIVHRNFLERVSSGRLPQWGGECKRSRSLSAEELVEIFESQVLSRQLDRVSRMMQARGEGFYTIGTSGHENTAAIAAAFRLDDMAFLHYRDAAFQIQRSKMLHASTPTWDLLLSFAASADDPISGGRHKVLGSKSLFIPPQTSTIASHLPKAVGTAYSIALCKRHHPDEQTLRNDSVVICSFGDASANHSTAQGAINTACWTAYQKVPMPLVLICEDNGIGISTKTPTGWIEATFKGRPSLKYISCDGLDLLDTHRAACEAADYVRHTRMPVLLHMRCVRLYGHAGSDEQTAYMSQTEIERTENDDPLQHSAAIMINAGILTRQQIVDIYLETGERCERVSYEAEKRPRLQSADDVMQSLIPPKKKPVTQRKVDPSIRAEIFGRDLVAMEKTQPMSRLISWGLTDLMIQHRQIILAGEDIGPKGGVYNVTAKLCQRFGADRIINTLLDEQSILGLAMGLAHNGFLPIPEIQFLAYLHNAEDQLRGEAATLSFFSKGQFTNPMIVRIAGLGYQKGIGGHFHNDNSLVVLRDIPGLIIACPSNGSDAVWMLRECVRLALEEQRVIVFIEPIALYRTRDLHQEGDHLWNCHYPDPDEVSPLRYGMIGQHGKGKDLAIISYANGYYLSRQVEQDLRDRYGLDIRIIDIRWLAPLPEAELLSAVKDCSHILIVDECRTSGSHSEAIMTMLVEHGRCHDEIKRLTAKDSFIALGKAAEHTLPSSQSIIQAALDLIGYE